MSPSASSVSSSSSSARTCAGRKGEGSIGCSASAVACGDLRWAATVGEEHLDFDEDMDEELVDVEVDEEAEEEEKEVMMASFPLPLRFGTPLEETADKEVSPTAAAVAATAATPSIAFETMRDGV